MSATVMKEVTQANESTWLKIGSLNKSMDNPDKALEAYGKTLQHNPNNVSALLQTAMLYKSREDYANAVDYFRRVLNVDQKNGTVWGHLGHCCLMMDDLQKAYAAYQQALYYLPNPKDPNLWYGIGILYDRYGSHDHAQEAFTAVLKMEPQFEKAAEIYFRLGNIYKQQMKYNQAYQCFRYILATPPPPVTEADIWFQIGHVCELQKDYPSAKEAYERVLQSNPKHARILQQLGWLYHSQPSLCTDGDNQEKAIEHLKTSLEVDASDAQSWYLLGRCYMAQAANGPQQDNTKGKIHGQYRKAYDAYQQAVYRDGRNPIFWCSIGVLYYRINQYRDALDAYSRAIRLYPYLSEVWYDLGTLYETCNQIQDSFEAYQRAAELDPSNRHIQHRLQLLRKQLSNGAPPPSSQQPMLSNGQGHLPSHLGPQGPRIPTSIPPHQQQQQQQQQQHQHQPPPMPIGQAHPQMYPSVAAQMGPRSQFYNRSHFIPNSQPTSSKLNGTSAPTSSAAPATSAKAPTSQSPGVFHAPSTNHLGSSARRSAPIKQNGPSAVQRNPNTPSESRNPLDLLGAAAAADAKNPRKNKKSRDAPDSGSQQAEPDVAVGENKEKKQKTDQGS